MFILIDVIMGALVGVLLAMVDFYEEEGNENTDS
jgi:hypothetical protein